MARYVLVHGGWHGAWCWHQIVPRLEAAGHAVRAVDLPGRGRNMRPLAEIVFGDYVKTVCDAIAEFDERAVVVGHSLGGVSVTAAAERMPDRVARLVYLTAFLPGPGQSVHDIIAMPEMRFAEDSLLARVRLLSDDGRSVSFRPELLRETFYADCSEEDFDFASSRLCAEPVAAATAPITYTAERFGGVPRDYVFCTADRAIPLTAQRQMVAAVGCDQEHTLPSSHSPFFSMPGKLVEVLLEAATM